MIHSARPTVSPVVNIAFTWKLFCFLDIEKWGRTDNMCENNHHYRPCLWVGQVDQKEQELGDKVVFDFVSLFYPLLLQGCLLYLVKVFVRKWGTRESPFLCSRTFLWVKLYQDIFEEPLSINRVQREIKNWSYEISRKLKIRIQSNAIILRRTAVTYIYLRYTVHFLRWYSYINSFCKTNNKAVWIWLISTIILYEYYSRIASLPALSLALCGTPFPKHELSWSN